MYHKYSEKATQNFEMAQEFSEMGNKILAFQHYLKAAEAGIVPAMTACGNFYLDGEDGIKQDIEKAVYWFKKAAALNNVTAMNNLGYIYEIQNEYALALHWYKKSAELGDITAMMNLSGVYKTYYKDRKSEKFWVNKAESCSDLDSVLDLAHYYVEAGAIRNHIQKAIEFFEKAIEMGDTDSLNELGDLYFYIQNFEAAESCYARAAKLGDVNAMANFGFMMIYSDDFETAYYWIKKAIKGGSSYALQLMGDLYAEYKQYPRALRWYRKAAIAGESDSLKEIRKTKKLLRTEKADYKLRLRNLID